MTDEKVIYHKMYQVSDKWPEFLERWNKFLKPAKQRREMSDFRNFFRRYGVPHIKDKETLIVGEIKFWFEGGRFLHIEPKHGPVEPRKVTEEANDI